LSFILNLARKERPGRELLQYDGLFGQTTHITFVDNANYVEMDVHKETKSIMVSNSSAKLVMESGIETKAIMIFAYVSVGLGGDGLQVRLTDRAWAG